MAGSEAKRHHRHDLDCRPRDYRRADAVVCACTSDVHPVAVQRACLWRLKVSDLASGWATTLLAGSFYETFEFPLMVQQLSFERVALTCFTDQLACRLVKRRSRTHL